MIGIFYVSNKIPITLPLFIAMTAIARLIILQGKGIYFIILIYEEVTIYIISLACLLIRYKAKKSNEKLLLMLKKIKKSATKNKR